MVHDYTYALTHRLPGLLLRAIAREVLHLPVSVLQIDGTKERVLVSRFHVEAFPSIFHLKGPEMREYTGLRTLTKVLPNSDSHEFCATFQPFVSEGLLGLPASPEQLEMKSGDMAPFRSDTRMCV